MTADQMCPSRRAGHVPTFEAVAARCLRSRNPSRRALGDRNGSASCDSQEEWRHQVTALYTATSNDVAVFGTFGNAQTVPGMWLTVNVPQRSLAIFLITFSAETNCVSEFPEGNAGCEIRATVDGKPASPGFVEFASAPDPSFHFQTQSMQFVAGPIGSGAHVVRIRWSVSEENMSFVVNGRTMSVLVSKVARSNA